MEGSSPGVEFQPGDDCSESIHRSRNDNSGDRYTVHGGEWSTITGCDQEMPHHLQDLVDQTSDDLDTRQRHRLAEVLLKYADIFPIPGDPLTDQYGRPATHLVCATPHVTPEDEKRGRMCH